jgi:hypothetical protein
VLVQVSTLWHDQKYLTNDPALAGLDMAMPGDGDIPFFGLAYWAYELSTSILNGSVPLSRLNDMGTFTEHSFPVLLDS